MKHFLTMKLACKGLSTAYYLCHSSLILVEVNTVEPQESIPQTSGTDQLINSKVELLKGRGVFDNYAIFLGELRVPSFRIAAAAMFPLPPPTPSTFHRRTIVSKKRMREQLQQPWLWVVSPIKPAGHWS